MSQIIENVVINSQEFRVYDSTVTFEGQVTKDIIIDTIIIAGNFWGQYFRGFRGYPQKLPTIWQMQQPIQSKSTGHSNHGAHRLARSSGEMRSGVIGSPSSSTSS